MTCVPHCANDYEIGCRDCGHDPSDFDLLHENENGCHDNFHHESVYDAPHDCVYDLHCYHENGHDLHHPHESDYDERRQYRIYLHKTQLQIRSVRNN